MDLESFFKLILYILFTWFGPNQNQNLTIIDGEIVTSGFHHVVQMFDIKTLKFLCTGNIVTDNAILVAAHCFFNEKKERIPDSDILVYVGSYILAAEGKHFATLRTSIMPGYKVRYQHHKNDIGIIFLKEKINFNDPTKPAAKISITRESERYQGNVLTAGWGVYNEEKISTDLRKAKFSTVDFHYCSDRFVQPLTDEQICFKNKETSMGDGDSGAGYTHNNVLIAIHDAGSEVKGSLNVGTYLGHSDVQSYLKEESIIQ